ncbi:hypothetical protein K450DRAFT_262856 [Umbelopsis ramanniana AG]|uniref:GPI ethanolamine phosphate transferase 3 n=1 Tax=Umbelopsis ramanniana AG TaxID=1314678 RepID=A0AAD5E1S1_UMBRA|nr:uncharacterized protein K450DRAFT_262856 [Umbelopsis ramanniana AG]KAI8575199.1 hypothetical protein K450DRAFT_262856 [Umbelopsis ramanniana AG]
MNASYRRPFAIFLVWVSLAYTLGIYLFLNGFLLTRQTLHVESTHLSSPWNQFPLASGHDHVEKSIDMESIAQSKGISDIYEPPFQRAIIVLIDALRFDFLPKLGERPSDQFYTNRLPIVQDLLDQSPESTVLFQFRADPPTTTMQRLKALMTGSLPTFIDAGSNFASSDISEDHLLRHLTRRFKSTYFMGDDTWINLFSDVLNDNSRTFPFDSFKVFDLDTVDHGILGKLWPLLDGHLPQDQTRSSLTDTGSNSSQWDCIITHFLGVDHCGHTYGPSHPSMAAKLDEMNTMLQQLVQYVDEDTLLILFGDHGMSVAGDHGGESEEEVMSGLLLHSKRPLTLSRSKHTKGDLNQNYFQHLFSKIHRNRDKTLSYDHDAITTRLGYDATAYPIVSQIHLVPTLSYLFGTPIPFGNLGALIPDLLYPKQQVDDPASLLYFIQQFRINALQVYNYLTMYSSSGKHKGFSISALDPLFQILYAADRRLDDLSSQTTFKNWIGASLLSEKERNTLVEQLEDILMTYDEFLIATLKYCMAIWAQFDVGCMVAGSVILFAALLTIVGVFIKPSWIYTLHRAFNHTIVRLLTILGAAIGLIFGFVVAHLSTQESGLWYLYVARHGIFDKMSIFGWTATLAFMGNIAGLAIAVAVQSKLTLSAIQKCIQWISHNPDVNLVLITGLAHALTLGSNSFIVYEDSVVRFILASWSIYWLIRGVATSSHTLRSLKSSSDLWAPIITLLFIQVTATTGLCREEQQPQCAYIHSGSLSLMPFREADSSTNENAFVDKWLTVIATTAFLIVSIFLCTFLPEVLQQAWFPSSKPNRTSSTSYIWCKILYGLSIGLIMLRYIYLILENTSSTQYIVVSILQSSIYQNLSSVVIHLNGLTATQWLRMTTRLFQIYIPRLNYAIGGLFLSFALRKAWRPVDLKELEESAWIAHIGGTIILATIQRPIGGVIILCWPLMLQNLTRMSDKSSISKTLTARLVILHYLGEHLFFVTGHQAILTAIHWETAFIGFDEMYMIPNAILVSLATLAGFIVSWSSSFVVVSQALGDNQDPTLRQTIYQASVLLMSLFNFIPTTLSSIFIIVLRRHLMTWKIFAPRFLLQCILFFGSCLYLIAMEGIIGGNLSDVPLRQPKRTRQA